jgi:hypothetical protein
VLVPQTRPGQRPPPTFTGFSSGDTSNRTRGAPRRDEDSSWIETMVHPNLRYWEIGQPMPQDKASLARWNRYTSSTGSVLEQEIFPISATITGNVAVMQYHYQIARENYKKERETVTGHYTDVLLKDNGKWLFIAWEGGDDPKK